MTIRYLMFDFFGTLVQYQDGVIGNPVSRSLRFLHEIDLPLDASAFSIRWQQVWDEIDQEARSTLREVHMHEGARRFFKALGRSPSEADVQTFVTRYIEDWNEGVVDIAGLDRLLATIDLDASIVSNTFYPPLVPAHVTRLGLEHRFDRIHTSIDHGFRKPHPSIYRAALDAAGVAAHEVLFVGDNPACDYDGPRRMGMRAVLVAAEPREGVPDAHRIQHIVELRRWLDEHADAP